MSSPMVSRWPVRIDLPLGADDRDDVNTLTEDAIERLFAEGRRAYFAQCASVGAVAVRESRVQVHGPLEGDAARVLVNVTELFPDTMTMIVRIAPVDAGDLAVEVSASVSPGEITRTMRDEFIALAHSARHWG